MKRSSHKHVYAGKSFQPGHNILVSYSFLRDSRNPIAVIYMPLSPMSKTSQLNITDQPSFPKCSPRALIAFSCSSIKPYCCNPVNILFHIHRHTRFRLPPSFSYSHRGISICFSSPGMSQTKRRIRCFPSFFHLFIWFSSSMESQAYTPSSGSNSAR